MTELEPKILIVSRAFDAGDAITTINLFSKWPRNKLFCATPIQTPFAQEFCSCYFLGDKECKVIRPLNLFERVPHSGIQKVNRVDTTKAPFSFKRKVYKRWVMPILKYIDLYDERFQINLSEDFCKWVELIRPDVIYSSVGDISIAMFLLKFNARFPEIKLAIHGFDDWITPSYKILWSENHINKADALLSSLISKAVFLLSTTEMMAREYEKRYGRKFVTFHNPVEFKKTSIIQSNRQKTKLKLTYIGKVSSHNAKAISDMTKAVEHYNSASEVKIYFTIYTQSTKDVLDGFNIKCDAYTSIHPPIGNSAVAELLMNSNILYLPITITEEIKRFTRYSMSTKMGEYLASSTPVIYCGPEGIAMTEFFKELRCGICITTPGIQPLEDGLKYIMTHPAEIEDWKVRGKEIADKYFNKDTISNQFLEYLQSLFKD